MQQALAPIARTVATHALRGAAIAVGGGVAICCGAYSVGFFSRLGRNAADKFIELRDAAAEKAASLKQAS